MKLLKRARMNHIVAPFSILERIDVGETTGEQHLRQQRTGSFSILERIDVGETSHR